MNIDRRRKFQCFQSKCKFYEQRCIVYYGYDCAKLGGNRIPIQRIPNEFREPTQEPTGFKPYFISPSGVEGEL